MRIFDETKTTELEHYNPEEGYFKPDKLVTHYEAIPEKVIKSAEERADELSAEGKEITRSEDGKLYVTTEYFPETGGRTVEEVLPQIEEGTAAWDEEEQIAIFVPFTESQKAKREIQTLKQKLSETDYKAIKYAEGYLTEEEYAPTKAERQSWRDRINKLEKIV